MDVFTVFVDKYWETEPETVDHIATIPLFPVLPRKYPDDPSPLNQETETLQNPETAEIEEYDPFKVV
jgi:hypothetical protein